MKRFVLWGDESLSFVGMRHLLKKSLGLTEAWAGSKIETFTEPWYRVDLLVVAFHQPPTMLVGPLEDLRKSHDLFPKTIVVLNAKIGPSLTDEFLTLGVKGFFHLATKAEDLPLCVGLVLKDQPYLDPAATSWDITQKVDGAKKRGDVLTTRERETLVMLASGYSVKEIATKLNLAAKTAEAHKFNLMRKLRIHNKALLVQYAIEQGYIQLTRAPLADVGSALIS